MDEDEDIYDQFGNYVGPELLPPEAEEPELEDEEPRESYLPEQRIVLHEDKTYYPEHREVYPDAQVLIEQEDAQPLETPIIASDDKVYYDLVQDLDTTYETKFLQELAQFPEHSRNVVVLGALHHGKTRLIDLFVREVHTKEWEPGLEPKWTDSRLDQQQRGISVKAKPISMVLSDGTKSRLITFIDTPGHSNFTAEVELGCRLADGAIIVVDAVEGVLEQTRKCIRAVNSHRIVPILVISKLDRLFLELKLPPEDSYLKLRQIISEVSQELSILNQSVSLPPEKVFFTSANYNLAFSCQTFANRYQVPGRLLWGDYSFDRENMTFGQKRGKNKRSFVEFVLQPIYKICSCVLTKERVDIQPMLASVGIRLKVEHYWLPAQSVLMLAYQQLAFSPEGLVRLLVQTVQSAERGSRDKLTRYLSGASPTGFVIDVVKLMHSEDRKSQRALGRVVQGSVKVHQQVWAKNNRGEKQLYQARIEGLYLSSGRSLIPITEAKAGFIVLVEGVDKFITKSATLFQHSCESHLIPVKSKDESIVRVTVQPFISMDLPKLLDNLRSLNKEYHELGVKVEETGEHILLGTGELEMDCVLHDLRHLYQEIELRISDPSVIFSETVKKSSSTFGVAASTNGKNKVGLLARPLDKRLAQRVESEGEITPRVLEQQFNWDIQLSTGVFMFGPNSNMFVNATLPQEVSEIALREMRQSLVQGYSWAAREGPLCDEPIRHVQFDLARLSVGSRADSGPGQVIPMARRACYSSFLLATPRILEPMLAFQTLCIQECLPTLNKILKLRRGFISKQVQVPATPLLRVLGGIPALDSFGFETDLRVQSSGLAFVTSWFSEWSQLEGDPLDETVVLHPLQPAEVLQLPREIMVKTRRRKGLAQSISLSKYFDTTMLQ